VKLDGAIAHFTHMAICITFALKSPMIIIFTAVYLQERLVLLPVPGLTHVVVQK